MRLLTLFFISFSISVLFAQEQSIMECHYTETFKNDLGKKENIRQDEMILRIGKTSSEFFSYWLREREHVTDSLTAKGASLNDIIAAREKMMYPISVQYYTIYKNYPQKGMLTHTDNLAMQHYMCTEKLEIPDWKIQQEKTKILGFNCQKATTTFCGRKWNVWFTPEIPNQEGPWKLCGLPGLILQAEDSEKDYCFKCIEIKKTDKAIQIPKRHYIKCSKERFTKEVIEFNSDLGSFMMKQGKSVPIPDGGNQQDAINYFKKRYNYIER